MSVRMESNLEGTSRAAESMPHQFDVFINHRGPDVKNTFVSHLDDALRRGGLRPFLDAKDIELGRDVDNSIDEALNGSCVFVAIFSERYAESRHCLNELCKMMELTQLSKSKKILPVFYHVEPNHLRHIEDGPFKEGFRKHEEEETEEQILKWKEALHEISGTMGLELTKVNGNEAELVRIILAEVRRLMPIALPDPAIREDQRGRRLNVLVLGNTNLVEDVVNHICGARRHIQLRDHIVNCGLTGSWNSWPPIYLYGDTDGNNNNDLTNVKAFVKTRNQRWHDWNRTMVEARNEVYRRSEPRELADRTLRLHMVWAVCRNRLELTEGVKWSEITEKLYGLPVQILVIGTESTQNALDSAYKEILVHKRDYFPNARNLKELIEKVSLTDGDLKENLWRKCWTAKTRAEIENVAKLIRGIRKELGPAGISVNLGVLNARLPGEVSLSRSGEFVLRFLCTYWDVPQDKMHGLLESATFGLEHGNRDGYTIIIRPCEFVKFCLIVAAIVLSDTWRNPEHIYNWDDTSDVSSDLLRAEAERCYRSYFRGALGLAYYDRMRFGKIREFLQDIFKGTEVGISLRDATPRPVVVPTLGKERFSLLSQGKIIESRGAMSMCRSIRCLRPYEVIDLRLQM